MDSLRQGDIGFFRIPEVPAGFLKTGTTLEVRGESGRHVHRAEGVEIFGATAVAEKPPANSDIDQEFGLPVAIIRAFEETTVVHDVKEDSSERPHEDLILPAGIYEVRQARQRGNRRGD